MTWYDDAMRTIIEVPADQLTTLDALCRRERISRAEAIRRAVSAYIRPSQETESARAFGVWKDRGEDGLAYQERLRSEWNGRARRR